MTYIASSSCGCNSLAASSSKHPRVLFESCSVFSDHVRLSTWCSVNEATDWADLVKGYLSIWFVHLARLATNSWLACIHYIIINGLHACHWMLRALVRLIYAVLLVLKGRRFPIGIIVFWEVQLRTRFFAGIVFKVILSPIPKLIV
jgi:hypothetical protein